MAAPAGPPYSARPSPTPSPRCCTAPPTRSWAWHGWSYDRFEVDEAGAARRSSRTLGPEWAGLSLTMPLKRAVIPLLDEISETAASVDAVNTVVLTEDGRRIGDNTDIPGMVAALREHGIDKVDVRRRSSARAPPPPPRWPRSSRDLPGRDLRVRAQRGPGRRDARSGASGSASTSVPPTGPMPSGPCAPPW